jgi:hypothetical protein
MNTRKKDSIFVIHHKPEILKNDSILIDSFRQQTNRKSRCSGADANQGAIKTYSPTASS